MLIINFLENYFRLFFCEESKVADRLQIQGISYEIDDNSKSNEGFIGFFDWLRTGKNDIVGIRLNFFEHQLYNDYLTTLSYILVESESRSTMLLFEGSDFEPRNSADQDFTNNYVYKSNIGGWLFTFGLDHLTKSELDSLRKHCISIEAVQSDLKHL